MRPLVLPSMNAACPNLRTRVYVCTQVNDPMMRNLQGAPLVPPVAIVAAALGVRLRP